MMERNSCRDFEWMVGPLVDGELPAPEAERAEGHLQDCPSCRQLVEDFRALDRLASSWEAPPPVSAAQWNLVWEGIVREPSIIRLPSRLGALDWVLPVVSMAALALLAAWVAVSVVTEPERLNQNAIKVLQGPPEEFESKAPEPPKKTRSS